MDGEGGGAQAPLRRAAGEIVIAFAVIGLAAIVWWRTRAIPVSPIYAQVGPTIIPMIAALGLGGLGFALLVAALRGGWQPEEERAVRTDRLALLWVVAGLVLNIGLIGRAGFTLASAALFVCVARGFGSRRILRDALTGIVFALVAYFGFARTLGIDIGAGLMENAIEALPGMGRP